MGKNYNDDSYLVIRRKIIFDALDKFPNSASLTIAKILFRDNPGFFADIENVRDSVRYYRGAHGDSLRNRLADKKYVRKPVSIT